MLYTRLLRTKNAIRFKLQQSQSTWLVIGQTDPWTTPYSDINPPPDDPLALTINNPVLAVKALVIWVEEDGVGPYIFRDPQTNLERKFSEVTDQALVISGLLNLVLIQAQVLGLTLINLGFPSFRQVGFSTDLIPTSGNETATILPAANVQDWGNLETIANRVPVSLIASTTYVLTELIQF